jgi:hypothetical protein
MQTALITASMASLVEIDRFANRLESFGMGIHPADATREGRNDAELITGESLRSASLGLAASSPDRQPDAIVHARAQLDQTGLRSAFVTLAL